MEARGIHKRQVFDITPSLVRRFEAKFTKGESPVDCWIWTAGKRKGYGSIGAGADRLVVAAHIVSYRIAYGDIPDGHVVRHTCDVRACVNPQHLISGTPHENYLDAVESGSMKAPKLTPSQVVLIRAFRILTGHGARRISKRLGIKRTLITSVIENGHWKHVPTPTPTEAKQIIAEYEASQC